MRHLIQLEQLDEIRRDVATTNEAHKRHVKAHYDKFISPYIFSEGDLVQVYNQANYAVESSKFISMLHNPYIIKHTLIKGAYELEEYNRNVLKEHRNGIYLKRY